MSSSAIENRIESVGPPTSAADIHANARALGGYLREKSDAIEEARQLPREVAARLREAGMFRLMMPKEWGGPEMCPAEQVEVIEELAKANASAAWCVMIGCDSGFFAGFLEDSAAREIYPSLDMPTAGSATPSGRAERVSGGYRVSGEWSFGSGVTHADVVELACALYQNGAPVKKGQGTPVTCGFLTPASNVTVVDNWRTTGMRGTGSCDYSVKDLFVPERFLCNIRPPARRPGVLWRRSTNFLPKVAGVPLGMARAVIDYAVDTIKSRVEIPSGRPLRNSGRLQSVIADAEMMLGAARSYVFAAMEREWTRLDKNEQPSIRERTDAWLSRVNAAQAAREIIRMLYDALGSASIYSERSPLDRALRDAETVCQHIVMQRKTLTMAGTLLLEADTPVLPYI
jgi:alkylation response protein AidB-like acyl-CoA dehydrogenase